MSFVATTLFGFRRAGRSNLGSLHELANVGLKELIATFELFMLGSDALHAFQDLGEIGLQRESLPESSSQRLPQW